MPRPVALTSGPTPVNFSVLGNSGPTAGSAARYEGTDAGSWVYHFAKTRERAMWSFLYQRPRLATPFKLGLG